MYEKIHSWPNGMYEVGLVISKYEQKSKYPTTVVQLSLISAFIDMWNSLYDAEYRKKKFFFDFMYSGWAF